jgi:hypothetical protein
MLVTAHQGAMPHEQPSSTILLIMRLGATIAAACKQGWATQSYSLTRYLLLDCHPQLPSGSQHLEQQAEQT